MQIHPLKLQHQLVVTGIDKRKLKKVVKNEQTVKKMVQKLNENNMKTKFQERVKELVDVDAPSLWHTFKNSMLQACNEVCGKKKGRKKPWGYVMVECRGEERCTTKKVAYKNMCKNRSDENKTKYKNIRNQTKKVVANSMRKKAKKELTKLNKNPNNIFTLVKFMKRDWKDFEVDRCMRGKDGRLGFSEEDRKRI